MRQLEQLFVEDVIVLVLYTRSLSAGITDTKITDYYSHSILFLINPFMHSETY